jgi:phosphate starvation-inducible protein PhoH
MRGRTLNDAYVILDEAQNTTIEQMKMFLTRIGFGSTAVVTGDMTQIDLPKHQKSGLKDALEVLRNVNGISFTFFESRDVVRHPAGRAHRQCLRRTRFGGCADRPAPEVAFDPSLRQDYNA